MPSAKTYAVSRAKVGQYAAEHATYPLTVVLVSGYVYDEMHEDLAEITGELSGGGYARQTLTGVTLTANEGVTFLNADDVTFPALTAADIDGVILASDRGADSASPLVAYFQIAPTDVTAADLPIAWNAAGIVQVTPQNGIVLTVAGVEPDGNGDVPVVDLRAALDITAGTDAPTADTLIRSDGFDPEIGTFAEAIIVGPLGAEGNRVATIPRATLVGRIAAVIDTGELWAITSSGPCTYAGQIEVDQHLTATCSGLGGPYDMIGASSDSGAEPGDPATYLRWDATVAFRRLNNVVTSIHDGDDTTDFIEHDGGDPVVYGTIDDGSLNQGLEVYKPATFSGNTVTVDGQSYTFNPGETTVIWLKSQANAAMNGAYELTADYDGDFGPADDVILYRTVVWNSTTDDDPTSPRYQQALNLFVNGGGDHVGLWVTEDDGIAGTNITPAKVAYIWANRWDDTAAAAEPAGTLGYAVTNAGGGGSGSVATDTIWDAKGDLAVGTGANTAAKLTAGANDTILMAASGEATGLKWANASTARTALGLAIGTDVQAYDADLAAVAALAPSNDDVLQRKAGAWTNRTLAQLSTDLRLTQMAYKTVDESVTSSTTVQDDDHLTFAIGANETWYCEFNLSASGGTTGDLKVTVTMPSGATSELVVTGVASGGTTAQNSIGVITSSASSEVVCGLQAGTGNRNAVTIEGCVFNSSTAGNVTLQWAQGTSDGTATTVRKGSTVIYRRLA